MADEYCPLCGDELSSWGVNTSRIAGWRICAKHPKIYVKPSRYAGRCNECLGPIAFGEEVVMHKDDESGRWVILHQRKNCKGMPETPKSSSSTASSGGGYLDQYWRALYLAPGAPVEIIRAVYRELAKKHHPDKGGDIKRMQEINTAVEMLTK